MKSKVFWAQRPTDVKIGRAGSAEHRFPGHAVSVGHPITSFAAITPFYFLFADVSMLSVSACTCHFYFLRRRDPMRAIPKLCEYKFWHEPRALVSLV